MYSEGPAKKLINVYKSPIQVYNEVGEHILHLNKLLGRNISLNFKGTYICKSCNKFYDDLFRMGCCKKCFFESPLAGDAILRPEMSKAHLNIEPDIDKFLDETNLFDDWELALPQHEYPILVMAVLNDIRKDNIIISIVDSVYEETMSPGEEPTSKIKFKKKKSYVGEHPFN